MRYAKVTIERSEHLSIPDTVPVWVVPILQFIHGAEKVIVRGEVEVEKEVPDASSEYNRLELCYGSDVKTEKSYVAEIYGNPPRGVKTLERAIAASLKPAQPEDQDDDPTA